MDTEPVINLLSLLCFYTFNGVWAEFQLYRWTAHQDLCLKKRYIYITFHHHSVDASSIPAADGKQNIPELKCWTFWPSVVGVPQGWIHSVIWDNMIFICYYTGTERTTCLYQGLTNWPVCDHVTINNSFSKRNISCFLCLQRHKLF